MSEYPKLIKFRFMGPPPEHDIEVYSAEDEANMIQAFKAGGWRVVVETDPVRDYFDTLRRMTDPKDKRFMKIIERAEKDAGLER